jgi:hypothetical protein
MRTFLALIILALAGGGCATSSKEKVTKGDVQLVDQTVKSTSLTQANLELAIALLSSNPAAVAEALVALKEVRQAAIDSRANAEQLQENFGAPEDPKPYTSENSDAARKQSKEEHASSFSFWGAIGGGLAGLALTAWAVAKQTVLGQTIDTLVKAGLNVRTKAAAGTVTAEDVKGVYKATVAIAPAKVQATIEGALAKVKERFPTATPAPPPG